VALGVEHGHSDLRAEHLELLHRSRALDVGRNEQRTALVLLDEVLGELGARGGLARALQARHEHDRRRLLGELELAVFGAHQGHELFVARVHELLRGLDALEHLRAEHALAHAFGEVRRDLEVDVGFEQRRAHGAQSLLDVLGAEFRLAAEEGERAGQALGERFEHGREARRLLGHGPRRARARQFGPELGGRLLARRQHGTLPRTRQEPTHHRRGVQRDGSGHCGQHSDE
jgi:hypothetical protein